MTATANCLKSIYNKAVQAIISRFNVQVSNAKTKFPHDKTW